MGKSMFDWSRCTLKKLVLNTSLSIANKKTLGIKMSKIEEKLGIGAQDRGIGHACLKDNGNDYEKESAMSKYFASKITMQAASKYVHLRRL